MKICISGPQCAGKSTLMRKLKECGNFDQYHFIDEPVRRLVKEKNIKINQDSNYESQMTILEEHHRNIYRHPKFITDRGALDAFTYATHDYLVGKYSFKQWKSFYEIYVETMHQYDHIFLLPPLEMKDDGFRSLDVQWQEQIYNLMTDVGDRWLDITSTLSTPIWQVPQGSPDSYVKYILVKL